MDEFGLLVVADPDAKRGTLGYPGAPVGHRGEFGERSPAGPAPALLLDVDRNLAAVGRLEILDQLVRTRARVPDVELWHRRVLAHAPAVGLDPGGDRRGGPGRLDPVLPRRHHKTGGKALDVP